LEPPSAPARWLVALRWVAILGMFITTIVARRLVPSLESGAVLVVLGCLTVVNMFWTAVVTIIEDAREPTVAAQLLVDVLGLSAVLWFSGGVGNPFASFLSFQIVLAGMLGARRTMLMVTALAMFCACVLAFAEPLNFNGALFLGEHRVELLADVVSLAALGAFTGFFVRAYAQRLDEMREQTARSEKLAALGRTMGAMAHELNTPLGTIVLASKELTLVAQELNNQEVERMGETIGEEARRASDIIALLRGYIRPDARREMVDVGEFVEAYAQKELDRLRFGGQRDIRVAAALEAAVLKSALCQILTNVLTNAVDAMGRDADKRLEIEVTDHDQTVEVTVKDFGPGINPALLPRLGEPFQTTKGDQGGTGLGLYVSSMLADRMGANLHLDSVPGEGTRVTLTLQKLGAAP